MFVGLLVVLLLLLGLLGSFDYVIYFVDGV